MSSETEKELKRQARVERMKELRKQALMAMYDEDEWAGEEYENRDEVELRIFDDDSAWKRLDGARAQNNPFVR